MNISRQQYINDTVAEFTEMVLGGFCVFARYSELFGIDFPVVSEKPEPAPGQIWELKKGDKVVWVVLTHTAVCLRGVIASPLSFFATSDDIICARKVFIQLALMPCTDRPLNPSFLHTYRGQVSDDVRKALLMNCQRFLTGGFRLKALKVCKDTARVTWTIDDKKGTVVEFKTGARATDPNGKLEDALHETTQWVTEGTLDLL